MAKMKRNIGDLVSGKIGNVVFVRMGGESYVRSAPKRTKESWSGVQNLYRKRLCSISALWRSIRNIEIQKIWTTAAVKMTGYNLFIKKNMDALSISGDLIDPKLIQVSDGSLPIPLLKLSSLPENPRYAIYWKNDINLAKQRLTDSLMFMTYSDLHFSTPTATGVTRANIGCVLDKPPIDPLSKLGHVYFFFQNSQQTLFSPSVSLEII